MAGRSPAEITSLQNPRVKAAVRLRVRRDREREGLTLVDGGREVVRAIRSGATVEEAFVCRSLIRSVDARTAAELLTRGGVPLHEVSPAVLAKVAFGQRSEGLVAIVRTGPTDLARLELPAEPLVAVIEAVEKPGNLGAILRTADGAGLDAVVAADPGTDLFNPNAIRASLGTIFGVPLAAAPAAEVLGWLRSRHLRIVAARLDAELEYTAVDLAGPLALVLGSEAGGLGRSWYAPDVVPVRLPMLGIADSLNVAAAAAILFYEARRQRGTPRVGTTEDPQRSPSRADT